MLSAESNIIIVLSCSFAGVIWAIINAFLISKIRLVGGGQQGESYNKFQDEEPQQDPKSNSILEVASYIEKGANTFLFTEYKYIGVFVVIMAFVIFFAVEESLGQLWTTVAFLLGAITQVICGYIGMRIAVATNYRVAFKSNTSLSGAFAIAYKAGCVFGFSVASYGLIVLTILICIYTNLFIVEYEDYTSMYQCLAGFGLGGSTIALFGRVGGGIYAKASDIGTDLVGKSEEGFNSHSAFNPARIADHVGANVGDVAGIGSDLFGSLTEALSAALVIAAASPTFYYQPSAFWYPLLLCAFGIVVCILVSTLASGKKAESQRGIADALKQQLIISTFLVTPALWFAGYLTLPERLYGFTDVDRSPIHAWVCALCGLWIGLFVGYISGYYTSQDYNPVKEINTQTQQTSILFGLSLGNLSTIVPVFLLAICAFVCHTLLGFFGVAIGALGMLSTLPICLAVDAFAPIVANANGIAEMCELGEEYKSRTEALENAGSQTSSIGRGFAIGAAAFVSFSLYGAFLTRAGAFSNKHAIDIVNVNVPFIFGGLLVGAMLPYAFSAFTIKSVGNASVNLFNEVKAQFEAKPDIKLGRERPNSVRAITIAAQTALTELCFPAFVCLGIPFLIGVLFGPLAIAGLLPGILISGLSMAISNTNASGAWNQAKRFVESGQYAHTLDSVAKKRLSNETVGDPLKDSSGPSITVLIKLAAVFSLVFAKFFDSTSFLQCIFSPRSNGC